MAARYPIPRPTEDAALWNFEPRRLAPERIADLLIVARATSDRYGQVLFDHLLDRTLGGTPGEA